MKKFIGGLFAFVLLVVIGLILTLSYKKLQPQKPNALSSQQQLLKADYKELNFQNLETELLNQDGTYFLWFCDNEDDNCLYLENEFMTPILNKLNIDNFENLHKVNFTNCPYSKTRMLNTFNVESQLAFVKVEVVDGQTTYSDAISWTEEDNFTAKDLEAWLYDHNIWQDAYKATAKDSN